ncbi:hypothetical protein [Aliterella atlantica]|uniref:Uncharacterized protein n=1 Tax=Aliterella atlantica CENA595 TaxID=1618023 RepID=A0A0D8ZVU7_9CYAN|nr:hypothetical protein [Aliterella atlantica]KJH72870.1 hypothetical protein UH38_04805 [Aliterella atlantica CENA595]
MDPNFDSNSSSSDELLLEQQILQEQSRRIMSNPNTIVLEPDASEAEHIEAIKKLLEQSDRPNNP